MPPFPAGSNLGAIILAHMAGEAAGADAADDLLSQFGGSQRSSSGCDSSGGAGAGGGGSAAAGAIFAISQGTEASALSPSPLAHAHPAAGCHRAPQRTCSAAALMLLRQEQQRASHHTRPRSLLSPKNSLGLGEGAGMHRLAVAVVGGSAPLGRLNETATIAASGD